VLAAVRGENYVGWVGILDDFPEGPVELEGVVHPYKVLFVDLEKGIAAFLYASEVELADGPTAHDLAELGAPGPDVETEGQEPEPTPAPVDEISELLDARRVAAVREAVTQVLRPYGLGAAVLVDPHAVLDIARFVLDEEFTVGHIEYPATTKEES